MEPLSPPSQPPLTLGQQKVMQELLNYIRSRALPQNTHLVEDALAQMIGTSRSPIRAVLNHLQTIGVARYERHRGYFLAVDASRLPNEASAPLLSRDEQTYLLLANARYEGALPDAATETDISRLLNTSRANVHKALLRAQVEGWAEKANGYGWEFLPMVNSIDAYDDLYAVRIALEPACILSPKFQPDRREIASLRQEQKQIAERDPASISPVEIFESNARFHATIASWSNNQVAIQILRRLDRTRRLAEYRQASRPLPRQELVHEHCAILDAIEAGDTLTAASMIRAHLDGARRKKVIPEAFGPATHAEKI